MADENVVVSDIPGPLVFGRDWWFVRVPRTGCTSACRLFGIPHRHIPLSAYQQRSGQFIAAFVRNPYDRLVSCWGHCQQGGMTGRGGWEWKYLRPFGTFDQWILDVGERPEYWTDFLLFRPQRRWLTVDGHLDVDFFGNFERYDEDMRRLCAIVGHPYRRIQINTTRNRHGRPWREYYTPETMKVVERVYAEDFALHEMAQSNQFRQAKQGANP